MRAPASRLDLNLRSNQYFSSMILLVQGLVVNREEAGAWQSVGEGQ